jgi:hypothetical protein
VFTGDSLHSMLILLCKTRRRVVVRIRAIGEQVGLKSLPVLAPYRTSRASPRTVHRHVIGNDDITMSRCHCLDWRHFQIAAQQRTDTAQILSALQNDGRDREA